MSTISGREVAAAAAAEYSFTSTAQSPSGLASNDEASRSLNAMHKLCDTELSTFRDDHAKKCHTMRQINHNDRAFQTLVHLVRNLIDTWAESSSKKVSLKKTAKDFNKHLNVFRGLLLSSSEFNDICFMNEQLKHVAKTPPKVRERSDMLTGAPIDSKESPFVVKLRCTGPDVLQNDSTGIRVPFDTVPDLLTALSALLSQTVLANLEQIDSSGLTDRSGWSMTKPIPTPNDILGNFGCIWIGKYQLTLRIFFTDGKYVNSNDPSLLHMLCGNKPPSPKEIKNLTKRPDVFKTLFPHVDEYIHLVRKAFERIIDCAHLIAAFRFTVVQCCRREPAVCDCITFGFKPQYTHLHQQLNQRKLLKCAKCSLELCTGHGCKHGVYHGETECESSIDEITEAAIAADSKRCPGCRSPIFKSSGCNHMTCRCGVHFCWVCSQELPKDERGQYSTTMHYSPDRYGIGIQGSICNQFD